MDHSPLSEKTPFSCQALQQHGLQQKRRPFSLTDENLANFCARHLFLDLILVPTTHKSDGHGIYEEREVTVPKPRLL